MKQKKPTRPVKLRTPEEQDERRGLGYAVSIHALLILLMLFGFLATPKNPNPVQIELWANGTTPTAAEPDTEPDTPDTPTPPPKPAPKETPPPTPVPPTPPVPTPPPAAAKAAPEPKPEIDPEIALEKARKEREKKEKEKAAQLAAEKAAAEKAAADAAAKKAAAEKAAAEKTAKAKEDAAKKEAAEKAAADKAAREKAAHDKAVADKKAKEQAAKKAADEKAAAEEAAQEKAAADKKAKEQAAKKAAEKAAAAKRDALRKAMRSDALGAAGIPGGTADRNQSGGGGNDNGYAAKVRACIRPRVAYPVPPRAGSNPTLQYRASLDPQGMVTKVEIQRSSGITGFDHAVATGIQNCSPFPKPPSGRYPSYIDGEYRMYE
ncbi:cell envelope integrity protein TolA [Paralcaligenes ginsengisoli]